MPNLPGGSTVSRASSMPKGASARQRRSRRATGSADFAWAFRLASEFVAGVLVGAALGWGLDRVAGTSPWGLIGFLLLGFAAGVLNVVRASVG